MITLHIPKKGLTIDLTKEINLAKNIKDQKNRKNTIKGLIKIKQYLVRSKENSNISIYWNDKELTIDDYSYNREIYFCGTTLKPIKKNRKIIEKIILFDLTNLTVAEIFEDYDYNILIKSKTHINNKHRKGGQSHERFARIREEQVKAWFKRINEKITSLNGKFNVGCTIFYYNQFFDCLTNENKEKIIGQVSSEYSDESGINQHINKLRGETSKLSRHWGD